MSFFKKFFSKEKEEDLNKGLEQTKQSFFSQITKAVAGKSRVDIDFLDDLENILISSDVGLETTVKIIDRLEKKVSEDKYLNTDELNHILKSVIMDILAENNTQDIEDYELQPDVHPNIILVVGVNGVGKTTTIGKISHQFKKKGLRVVLGAADTFRAAAVDQLKIWATRSDAHFYSKGMNTDPAAVAYETVQYAQNGNFDVAIIDTAGRLHTKTQLMEELTKIKRSIEKKYPGAPHEVLLVLDATTGQNAIEQARHFTAATNVTAIALTKLDGSAKGGVLGLYFIFDIDPKE
ncbi:MAG: signal recognition particle-docking protein FtsY [Saprospiraceae bacterium]|nr:signal recognition particle-docking protein FtsY [Saprospiraceae bacterium]